MTTKTAKPLSSITMYRERVPTNPMTAYKGPRMVADFSVNQKIIPDRNPSVLVEATNKLSGSHQTQTMNRSGVSAHALKNVMVGGSPDQPIRVYKSGQVSKHTPGRGTSKPKFQKGK